MAVELASLAVDMDFRPIEQGEKALERLTKAGERTENAMDHVSDAAQDLAAEVRRMAKEVTEAAWAHDDATLALIREGKAAMAAANAYGDFYDVAQRDFATQYAQQLTTVGRAHTAGAKTAKLQAHELANLGSQFADVGVSLASGQALWMVAIQQGSQIGGVWSGAAARGVTLNAALKGIAASAAPAAVALAPLVALAGAGALAFGLMHRELAKEYPKDITDGLGLTEEQLKRVEHRTVTMGDTFTATADVMGKYLRQGPLGEALDWLDQRWNATLDGITSAAFDGTASVVGAFIGGYRTIESNWRNFPAVLGDVFVMAANTAIGAVERLVNASVKGLNVLFDVLRRLPRYSWLPKVTEVELSQYFGKVSSAAEFTGKAFVANIQQAQNEVRTGMHRIGSEISSGALKSATDQALKDAGQAKGGPNGRHKKEAAEVDELAAAWKRLNDQYGKRNDLDQAWAAAKRNRIDPVGDMALIEADLATNYADTLGVIADQTRSAAQGMASAFGSVGAAIGGMTSALANYEARQAGIGARMSQEYASYLKAIENVNATETDVTRAKIRWHHEQSMAARNAANAQIGFYGQTLAAAKGFFKEGSKGYELMAAGEKAFRIVEFGLALQSIAMKGAEATATVAAETTMTGVSLAGSAARTGAKAAEGIAGIFAALGPFGFPVAAAATAVMVAAGVKMSGGGRGSAPGAGDMEARQKAQGTGSILGDSKAKSDSIAKSLEIVAANTNRDLEYSNGMLKALKSIDSGIGAMAAAVARSLSAGGALDTSDLNLGKTSTGPGGLTRIFAPISNLLPGLFGTRTTRTLQDQGLQFGSQSLSDILTGGIKGQTYQQVLENTQKKFLGLTYSNKDKVTTTTGALDADLSKQITDLIGSLKKGVLDAAGILGVTGAEATLDAFKVELGKMSFKDMSGAEIKEALNGIFGRLGDDLAATAIPELAVLQKVGEGAFETLARVARQYQVVDVSLKSIGMTFGAVGVSSLKARERLVDLAGGIDEFADQVRSFAETYLTDVERMAPIQRAVAEELARLNLTSVKTKDQFKNIVLGLDLTTEAGAQMYAALMALAPAFAKVIDFQTEGSKAVQDARDAVQAAYDRETEAAERMRDKFLDLAKSMRDLDKDLEALMDRTPAEAANRSADEFASILQKARGGDADAMGQLAGVTQNYAEALKGSARSRLEYDLGLAAARDGVRATEQAANRQVGVAEQQLATAKAMVAGILTVNDSVLSLAAAVANYRAAQQAQAVTPTPVTPKPTAPPPANDNPTPTPRAPDWDSYVQHYADVRAEGERLLATADRNSPWFRQHGLDKGVAGFGEWHWNNKGKGEGRTPYAAGGLMDRPITLGESGIGGEAGPEGILPLANVGGKMGVHAVVGREDSRQLAQMLGEMQRMNAALVAIARSNHEMNKNIRRILNEGISVHGAQPGDPVPTKAAA